jgi:hypothetical protein
MHDVYNIVKAWWLLVKIRFNKKIALVKAWWHGGLYLNLSLQPTIEHMNL